ncbi:hypothetical protein [Alkaliphilus peptidifermentans]|uniref:Uncharacterized protein n=1 Tax=Alkaliphilus peptidifermentans DSM 18978 TaxID=1120976 RepID=A0A1G5JLB3_9FIRM|nr:hypothetical protein [Alkaliphilus peptidifermentans]SCY88519.1 hypothetical protein SAMN03080606_02877 [Alkaliphilus peptidifermentans DSM 18978]
MGNDNDGAWLYDVIHCLASAYGWDKKIILEQIYPNEIEPLLKRIRRDEVNKNLTQLAIVHNPKSKNPKKLVLQLEKQLKQMDGHYYEIKEMDAENENKLIAIKEMMKENANKIRS